MWYLSLDESGDLGFDFVNKKPSKFFTVCILATSSRDSYQGIRKAAKLTLRRKVNKGGRAKVLKGELKGVETSFETKSYFYRQVSSLRFGIYALTLNKRRVYEELAQNKERTYNFVARKVLDQIPFEQADDRVQLTIDKSKGRFEIRDFDSYIVRALESRLQPKVPLNIEHLTSHEEAYLQAADLFAWGISRKYERGDTKWFEVFEEKVLFEEQYL
ncbi:MAG: DUF3800 domain-containing protein [Thermoleophilia bacterium]